MSATHTVVLTNGALYTMLFGTYGVGVGQAANANNNTLTIYGGSALNGKGSPVVVGAGAFVTGNRVVVNGGSATNLLSSDVGAGGTNVANSLTVTNGGLVTLDGVTGLRIASGNGSCSNWVDISTGGLLNSRSNSPISIGVGLFTWSNSLIVSTGGTVTNMGTLTVGNPTGTNNQLRLNGGSLSVSNLVCSNVNNTITFAAGTLNLRGAYISNNLPLLVGDGAQSAILSLGPAGRTNFFADGLTITNNATLTGVGGITGNTTVYGTNSPGTAGIGVITNSGNFELKPGSYSRFELAANTTAGSGWDLLTVTDGGTLTLGGTLRPILTGGFMPTEAMSFVIMTNTTANVSGAFANESSGKVNVYTNDSLTSLVGAFDITVVGSRYVVLNNFKPPLASGTVFRLR